MDNNIIWKINWPFSEQDLSSQLHLFPSDTNTQFNTDYHTVKSL